MIIETWAAFDQSITTMTLPNGQTIQLDSATMTLKEKLELCLGPLRELFEFNPNDDFILKPSATNKGAGIVVCNVFEQLEEVISDTPDIREWILQKVRSKSIVALERSVDVHTCFGPSLNNPPPPSYKKMRLAESVTLSNFESQKPPYVGVTADL